MHECGRNRPDCCEDPRYSFENADDRKECDERAANSAAKAVQFRERLVACDCLEMKRHGHVSSVRLRAVDCTENFGHATFSRSGMSVTPARRAEARASIACLLPMIITPFSRPEYERIRKSRKFVITHAPQSQIDLRLLSETCAHTCIEAIRNPPSQWSFRSASRTGRPTRPRFP
jgi:hypothetical protein